MNRLDLVRAIVQCEAAAKEFRAALDADVRREYEEQGVKPRGWDLPGVVVSWPVSHPSVIVTDEAKFLDYVKAVHPHQIETVVRVYPSFQRVLLDKLAAAGEPLQDDEGTVIPGLTYHPGGSFSSLSIRPSAELKFQLSRAAREMVSGAIPLGLPEVDHG